MREIVCPDCDEQTPLALDDDEPVSIETNRVEDGLRILASARGIGLLIHECGRSRRDRELRDLGRLERLRGARAAATGAAPEETSGSCEPTRWAIHVSTNMQGFEAPGSTLASTVHHKDHDEYIVLLGDEGGVE